MFLTTGVCLPWISLLFAVVVLGVAQAQRLGGHLALIRVVQPVLTVVALGATLLKLLLIMRAQRARAPHLAMDPAAAATATNLPYMSGGALRCATALKPCSVLAWTVVCA